MLSSPVVHNRSASFNYELLEFFEAGIVLTGPEVKSLRLGGGSLVDTYGLVRNNEIWLTNCYITPHGNSSINEPSRSRKLLLHRKQIRHIAAEIKLRNLTLVATKMYFVDGRVKVELALAKGRKMHDKRAALKEKDIKREIAKAIKRK